MKLLDLVGIRARRPKPRSTQPPRAFLRLETLEGRLVPSSVSGNAWSHPELVTLSFVPDGTLMTSGTNGNVYSKLLTTLNAKYPTATWQDAIISAAQTWAQAANVNLDVVSDNGTTSGQGAYQQGDPGMGDIRIGGYGMSNSYLAGAYMPPPANNYSIAGDINFNTSQKLNIGTTYDLQSVALHEFGHALGLGHTSVSGAVMYPSYHGITRGLTSDDIAGIQAIYGARQPDAYNTDPATANTSITAAASLTPLLDPVGMTAVVNNLSINSPTQSEFFTVIAPSATSATATVTVQSAGLSMFTPSLTVYAADQTTVLGSAASPVQYHGVTVSAPISNVTAGEQLYIKVAGVNSSAFSTGAFALTLNFGSGPTPAVSLPNTTTANGAVLTGGGGIPLTTSDLRTHGHGNSHSAPMDMLAVSEDVIPPCCRMHGTGCGCPTCSATANRAESDSAIDRREQAQEAEWGAWTARPRGSEPSVEAQPMFASGFWSDRHEAETSLGLQDPASMTLGRDACDSYFGQGDDSGGAL